MADLKLVGAVAIKVRPDAKGFRRDTQKELNRELKGVNAEVEVEVEVNADTSKVERQVEEAADEIERKVISLKVGLDYDSVRRAQQQFENMLKPTQTITFDINDETAIEEAREKLAEMMDEAEIEITYVQDEKGYQSVLNKINEIRRQKLEETVEFGWDDESLDAMEAEFTERLMASIGQQTVSISYDTNRQSLETAIKEVDKQLAKLRSLTIEDIALNEEELTAARELLVDELGKIPVEADVHYNHDEAGYKEIIEKIKAIERKRVEVPIDLNLPDDELRDLRRELQGKLDSLVTTFVRVRMEMEAESLRHAEEKAKELQRKVDGMQASMKINLSGTTLAAAQLAFVGRDRIVTYFASVNARSIAVAEGALKSLGGLNVLGDITSKLESMFTKFDQAALRTTTLATALGNLANIGVFAGTAMFRIGEGALQSLGLLAAAPAILGAATVGYTIFTAAFNNFFDAFNKDPKIAESALAALPPLARKTVESITGLYKGLANPIQEKFWENVGTTLSDSIETLYPKLKDSLLRSTDAVGDFVAGIGKSMNKLALTEDFDKMFAGFDGFFRNLSGASEPFFDAWNKFGVQGSQLLPIFGAWLTENAKVFDTWATKLSANGGITDMIMHGVHSLQQMWDIGVSIVDMFTAVSRAAGLAGTGGLSEFSQSMRRIADEMLAEPWQSKAATLFEGARKGAHLLNVGFKDLKDSVSDSAVEFAKVLELLGGIGGAALTDLGEMLGVDKFQSGIQAALGGIQKMIHDIEPAARDLGNIIGNLSTIAGTVFGNMGPVINHLFDMLDKAFDTVADNLAALSPRLVNVVDGLFLAAAPAVQALADALNAILDIMALVPNSFIVAGAAVTAFFGLRALASKFFESISGTKYFKNLEGQWLQQQAHAGRTIDKLKMVDGTLKNITVPTDKFSATRAIFTDLNDKVTSTAGGIRNLYDGFRNGDSAMGPLRAGLATTASSIGSFTKNALGGLMGALGGPWGLVLGGAAVAIGVFAQSQADAKAHVDDLTASIDAQTGALNVEGLKKIALAWTDIKDAGDSFANATRGAAAANETATKLKLNFADVTRAIAGGGPELDSLRDKLVKLGSTMTVLEGNYTGSGGESVMKKLRGDAEEAAKAFGLTLPQLEAMGIKSEDVLHLADNIGKEAAAAELARAAVEGLATATGTTTIAAQQMEAAMRTIGDSSTDAAGKIGAINKALDLLRGGGKLSAREAEVNAQTAFQNAVSQAKALREELAGNAHLIDQTSGLLDITSTSGLKLQQIMSDSADAIKIKAQAAFDAAKLAGKTPEVAAQAALDVVKNSQGQLDAIAEAAGVSADTLRTEWESFFGSDWELKATFSASADKFQAVREAVQASGLEWNDQVFKAFMDANPDPAKVTIDQAKKWGEEYAQGVYKAQLEAIPEPARSIIIAAAGQAKNFAEGNYEAVMKALNSTGPGVQAAINTINQMPREKVTLFTAQLNAGMYASVAAQLNLLSQPRLVEFGVRYSDEMQDAAMAARGGGAYNGAILNGRGEGRYGYGLQPVKYFANGGIERHVAQIASGRGPVRVWGEKETQGEAYIPYAQSKRPRSLKILTQVARDFGYDLTRAKSYANGGVVGGTSTVSNSADVHIGTLVTTDMDQAVRKLNQSRRDALAVAGIHH